MFLVQELTPQRFADLWSESTLSERASAQKHFVDLCRMLGAPEPPANGEYEGKTYAFERKVQKSGGGAGFADVFYQDHFAWEYKGKGRDLEAAYRQLLNYREALENPPLLVVCNVDEYRVHTNFTGTPKKTYTFTNEEVGASDREALRVLRALFTDPESLRPGRTSEDVTEDAARRFAVLADGLRERGVHPERAAHFLNKLLFCLFAEDADLLPRGLFAEVLRGTRRDPDLFARYVGELFSAMSGGGNFLLKDIRRFNGGLFDSAPVVELTVEEIQTLSEAAKLDWSSVEPAIFGTLFERSLDPSQRARLGAHYTSKDDILRLVEPVLMAPLRRRWEAVRKEVEDLSGKLEAGSPSARVNRSGENATTRRMRAGIRAFLDELRSVRVLDPACGSGNFLYVGLKELLDLEKEVSTFASRMGLGYSTPEVRPEQLHGIETSPYAHELAQVSVWIGYLQWMHDNGFGNLPEPILGQMKNILHTDAILAHDGEGNPTEPAWPEADVIIGNPPFLGGKRLRTELEGSYVDDLFKLYKGRVAREADLVCYWFEKVRSLIARGQVKRAGLLATNSIRGGANRKVLQRVKETGDIFFAESDRPWVLNGAAVRVSMVGFDDGSQKEKVLDGAPVRTINSDLTGSLDLTAAARLKENLGLAFMGDTKGGPFDLAPDVARELLDAFGNPNGRPNSDVVRPWVNGLDITRRPRGFYVIDFGTEMSLEDAALYEAPFEYVDEHVRPMRKNNKRKVYRERWWIHMEPRPAMRRALSGMSRFLATPTVAKHRLFVWLNQETVPDHQLISFSLGEADYFFGVLHSRAHELWSLRMGTFLGVGNDPRYTPTTCFETFPLPWAPGEEPAESEKVREVASAARALDELRARWLDPPGAKPSDLKKRTLTNLYNARPAWLENAHARLDRSVFAAYGWPEDVPDEEVLSNLLALNLERSGAAR